MSKESKKVVIIEGKVMEFLPNTMFRVETDEGEGVLCKVAGRMRRSFVRIMPGDRVRIETSPHDLRRGRIVRKI